MFEFTKEKELQEFLIENFNEYFGFNYMCNEFTVKCGRIDLIGEDNENIYIIELKRDIVTQSTIEQLNNYMNDYKTSKNIIGIASAPKIDTKIDLSLFKNNIRLQSLKNVKCLFNYKADTLKNKERIGTSLPIELAKHLKDYSEETMIPISRIIEVALIEYLEKQKPTSK